MKFKILYLSLSLISVAIVQQACKKEKEKELDKSSGANVHAPKFPSVDFVYTSSSSNSNKEIKLGRTLFYETYMSFNNLMSCGSCHNQSKAFANNLQFDKGVKGNKLTRNTPGINGNGVMLFWDGRVSNMADLVLKPVQNHNEMLQDASTLCSKLEELPYYKNLFSDAYGSPEITLEKIQSALTAFCNQFSNQNSEIEQKLNGQASTTDELIKNFSVKQKSGFEVFAGKGNCNKCHSFTGNYYQSFNTATNTGLDLDYTDNGLYNITKKESDKGKYKIPTLRNVALTAPYMHDGRFKTLREVVDFYNDGVQLHKNLSPLMQNGEFVTTTITEGGQIFQSQEFVGDGTIRKLDLTNEEKENLIEFLKMFTDNNFISDSKYSNPF